MTEQALALLGAAGLFLVALLGLWRSMGLGSLLRGTRLFLVDWFGEPERPGHVAIPGFPERMARVERRTADLAHDFRGEMTSRLTLLAYTVDRLHDNSSTAAEQLAALDARVTEHRRRNEDQVQLLRQAVEQQSRRLDEIRARSYRNRHDDPAPVGLAPPLSTED